MNEIETELQRNEEEYKILSGAELKLRQEYVDTTGAFLKGWFLSHGKDIAMWQSETTKQLGIEELKGLKAELNALAETAPAVAAKHFADCSYWMKGNAGYYTGDSKDMNSCLRMAAAAIAPLLSKRGYKVEVDKRNGVASMGGTLGEDSAMEAVRKRYDSNLEKMKTNRNKRRQMQEKLNRSEAADRWDSV